MALAGTALFHAIRAFADPLGRSDLRPLLLGGAEPPSCHWKERSDEAISVSPADGDCLASLAMTGLARCLNLIGKYSKFMERAVMFRHPAEEE
jgi:hypothetical protein